MICISQSLLVLLVKSQINFHSCEAASFCKAGVVTVDSLSGVEQARGQCSGTGRGHLISSAGYLLIRWPALLVPWLAIPVKAHHHLTRFSGEAYSVYYVAASLA